MWFRSRVHAEEDDATLAAEGRRFGRYLTGREPGPAIVERYVRACRTLFATPPVPGDAAVLAFARRHPWSIGLLDAAAALRRPSGALRGRLLVMAAILEATPEFAEDFLPRHLGPVALVVRVASAGIVAVGLAGLGVVLHAAVARRGA